MISHGRSPTLSQAEQFLLEAQARNPGPWVAHSRHVAAAARLIAERHPLLDPGRAEVLGLLHDIGRRAGVTGMRHVLDGYNFLAAQGFDDAARICLTHSFAVRRLEAIFGDWDCTVEELRFVEAFLAQVDFDDYDRLILLCDSLAMADGYVLMEKRMIDVALRYGRVNEHILAKWRETFRIKASFEAAIGCPVYALLPGVVAHTFGMPDVAAQGVAAAQAQPAERPRRGAQE
jgi:transposase-like protein